MASSNCCDYNAGMLRHTIDIEHRVLGEPSDDGGKSLDWDAYLSDVRAFVNPKSGREWLHASQLKSVTTHEVIMRYRAGVTCDMRVKYGTRYFNIQSIINVEERNRWLVLGCEEGVAQ